MLTRPGRASVHVGLPPQVPAAALDTGWRWPRTEEGQAGPEPLSWPRCPAGGKRTVLPEQGPKPTDRAKILLDYPETLGEGLLSEMN